MPLGHIIVHFIYLEFAEVGYSQDELSHQPGSFATHAVAEHISACFLSVCMHYLLSSDNFLFDSNTAVLLRPVEPNSGVVADEIIIFEFRGREDIGLVLLLTAKYLGHL